MNKRRNAYIRGDLTLASLNSFIQELQQKGDCELWLATSLHHRSPLSSAQLLQALITWARRSDPATSLHCYASSDPSKADFMDRFHGLIAALLGRRILSREGKDLTAEFISMAKDRLQWQSSLGRQLGFVLDTFSDPEDLEVKVRDLKLPSRGDKVLLLCADEYQEANDVAMLYRMAGGRWEPRPGRHFVNLLRKTFQLGRIGTDLKHAVLAGSPLLEHIGLAVAELFKNTDDWAKVNVRGSIIPNSCRGILIESLGGIGSLEAHLGPEVAQDPLGNYFSGRFATKAGERWAAVSISVFDSGDGLAQRWLGRPIDEDVSLQDELAAVLSCLRLHATTSERVERGIGLHQVMCSLSDLAVRGFLYLRTGRLCLYRNFATSPMEMNSPAKQDPYWLNDWNLRDPHAVRDVGRAEGTLLSFVFMVPLKPSAA